MAKKKKVDAVSGADINRPTLGYKESEWIINWLSKRQEQLRNNINTAGKNTHITKIPTKGSTKKETERQINNLYELDIDNSGKFGSDPFYTPIEHFVNIPEQLNTPSIRVHEFSHSLAGKSPNTEEIRVSPQEHSIDFLMDPKDPAFGFSYMGPKVKYNIDEAPRYIKKDKDYYYDPSEIYSRMMELRFNNNINPEVKVTPEDVKKYREVNSTKEWPLNTNALFDMFDDETLTLLLNDIAKGESNPNPEVVANKKMKMGGQMNQIYLIPTYADDYDEYGIGGILGSAASGAAAGASVGSIIPVWGTAAGAIIGGVSGLLKGISGDKKEKEAEAQAKKDMLLEKNSMLAQNRLQGLDNSANIPTFAKGGSLSAKKAKEILRDGKVHGKPLTAAQKRYFGWIAGGSKADGGKLPEGSATLKDAKDYVKAFPDEMKMGEEVEYEHTGNKKLAQRIAADHIKDFMKMTGTPGYYSALKQTGISDELNKMRLGGEIPRFGFFPTGGVLPTVFDMSQYNRLSEVSGPVRRDYYPVDYVGGTSPEQLGVDRGNIGKVDLTALTKQHAARTNKPLPEGYVGTVPATQNGYDYPMNEIAMQRYGAIPNLWQVSQKGKDYNYQLDPATGKLSTPSLRQMRSASDEKFRETMTPKEHLDYRQRRKQVEDYKANGGMIETNFLTEYKTGGTHEENSLGGIPVGGKARVEQGEYRFDDPDTGESYIFSNRF